MGPVPSVGAPGTDPLALRLGQAGGFQDDMVRGIPLTAQRSPDTPGAGVSGEPARCCCYTLTNVRDASGTAVETLFVVSVRTVLVYDTEARTSC
jgi:hypothetical protein